MTNYDGIIIGAGPNGLTTAGYLAKAGQKILVIDKRLEIGGGMATEEVTLPGFLHNTHAVYHMMVDYAPVFDDLDLYDKTDLRFIYPDLIMTLPLSDGRSLCLYQDVERTCASIGQFSKHDAESYRHVAHRFQEYVDQFLGPATYCPPMSPIDQVVKLQTSEMGLEINELSELTPRQIVHKYFENTHVRALFLYAACMWGLDYDLEGVGFLVPLMINRASHYRLCGEGSHHLAHVLSQVVYNHGGMVLGSQSVKRIIVEGGEAKGVELEDGTVFRANYVASSLNPHQTFLDLVGEEHLDGYLVQRIRDWQWDKFSLLGTHLALDRAPHFTAAEQNPDVDRSMLYILGYETEDDLIAHWDSLARGELTAGGFNCSFPSVHDPIQAPPGKCVGLLSQHAPHDLADGGAEAWYGPIRDEQSRRCIETLRRYAPNMTDDAIIWRYISTPLDVGNKFANMVRGSIKHGAYTPLQMGYLRPNEECSSYATPIRNLYVCGASTFPGGMVIFGAGYNAANVIAETHDIPKFWSEPPMVTRAKEAGLL